MVDVVDDRYPLQIKVSSYLTQKWTKTWRDNPEFTLLGASPPVMCDVNNDGIKEIFWAGFPTTESDFVRLICVNGQTGEMIWSRDFYHYFGEGCKQKHWPIMVYDFDKDGKYEIICAGASICRDAINPDTIKWQKSTNYFGWHNNGFIDYGDEVVIYGCGGGHIRSIKGINGDIINEAFINYTCDSGVGISSMYNDGIYDIALGTRASDGGIHLFTEDLEEQWSGKTIPGLAFTCSSQPPMMYDVDGDGEDEVIIGSQRGSSSKLYFIKKDGTFDVIGPLTGMNIHMWPSLGDVDGDGHMEHISANNTDPGVIDTIEAVSEQVLEISGVAFFPPQIARVLPSGYQIIATQGAPSAARIFQYTGEEQSPYELYQTLYSINSSYSGISFSVTGDVDNDGYNELVCAGCNSLNDKGGMSVWDTSALTPSPEPITLIALGGMRRLNNNIYYPIPGT